MIWIIYVLIGWGAAMACKDDLEGNLFASILVMILWPVLIGVALVEKCR